MAESAVEIAQKVKDAEDNEFRELFNRMDQDFDLWDMKDTPITADDTVVMQKTNWHGSDLNVVSNDLRAFSDNVQSVLCSADMQAIVRMAEETGEDKRGEMGKLERLFHFSLEQGDLRLRRVLFPPLRECLVWQGDIRGWTGVRILVYKDGDNVVFDFMPLDPRYLVYGIGGSGLVWSGYMTYCSKSAIMDEYPNFAKESDLEDRDNLKIDYWKIENDKIYNGVICNDAFLKNLTVVKIPSYPILVTPVSTRPPMGKSENSKGYGDSIFAPARKINSIRNRFISIVASHANKMASQALINYMDEQGKTITTTANVPGGVLNLPMGHNEIKESPMKEISPTVVDLLNWLNGQLGQATLPSISSPEESSGTRYALQQEAGNKIFNPQLRNLEYIYGDIFRLVEEQLIAGKLSLKIQGKEKDKYYETTVEPVDLKKPHTINVEFTAQTPWSQLDTYQVADMAMRQGLPQSFIHENILKIPDPKGVSDQLAIEMAEHSPKLAMVKAIQALLTYGRNDEAKQLMGDLYNMVAEEQMQLTTQGQQIEEEEQVLNAPPEVVNAEA
jgi:hypothetical protein